MRRFLSIVLTITMLLTFVLPANSFAESGDVSFKKLSDPNLLPYIESNLYSELTASLDSDEFFVENVSAIYISQEYLDELAFNSQSNIFFGYTLADLDAQFSGEKYVFTLGDNKETVVQPFESFDDTYETVLKNVAVGTGVILICVTVSVVSAGVGAPAVSVIFAAAAKGAAIGGLTGGAFGAVSAGIVTGIQTGDMSEAMKAAALAGSEGYKWGAITGAVSGGVNEAVALKGATLNGLTMNEAAAIQRDSHYPLDVIKGFKSMDQYQICKDAGLKPIMINGKTALVRPIDLDFVDDLGRTNLQRMQQGLAALDPTTGQAYQLHHIGQEMNSTLSILTEAEHMQNGNNLIWHELGEASKIDRSVFDKQRAAFWKDLARLMIGG